MLSRPDYLKKLRERAEKSRISKKHQLIGLEIAAVLGDSGDERSKALYMKLARDYGGEELLRVAKTVAERTDVRKPAAYFLSVLKQEGFFSKRRPASPKKKTAKTDGKRNTDRK